MVVPIDRVGGSMLTPRWSTPEELELDEVRHGSGRPLTAAPWQWLAMAPVAPRHWNHPLVALVAARPLRGRGTLRWLPGVSENWLLEDSPRSLPRIPAVGKGRNISVGLESLEFCRLSRVSRV